MKITHGVVRYGLEVNYPPPDLVKELENRLTFDNPTYLAAQHFSPYGQVSMAIPRTLTFYEHTETGIRLPRGFSSRVLSLKNRARFDNLTWQNCGVSVPATFPKAKLALNEAQQAMLDAFREAKRDSRRSGFLFVMPTAWGKTLLQAALAQETGQLTLVLCVTELILRAWYEDLQKMYGLKPKQIGLVKAGKEEWKSPFTLASVATIGRRRQFWPEYYSKFGTVVLDEAHIVSQPNLYEFLWGCPARYLIGATATPSMEGFNGHIHLTFGNPVKRINLSHKDTSTSMAIRGVNLIDTKFKFSYIEGAIDWASLSQALMDDMDRNDLIVQTVKEEWDQGRVILVTTRRIPHVELLVEMLKDVGVSDANALTGETNTDRAYTRSLLQMLSKRKLRCVVATNAAVKLGANIPVLDSLHLAMPVVRKHIIEQLLGRIRRRETNKTRCTVTYYMDRHVPYLFRLFYRQYVPVFRKMKIGKYANTYAV